MGNSSTKESRPQTHHETQSQASDNNPSQSDPSESRPPITPHRSSRSRHDGSFLGVVGGLTGSSGPEPRRETKQERDARRAKKEHAARLKERERSLREEGVDGGYLVTLGTYTGTEDFSKPVVRQLMLERRLAPFYRGLNDHKNSWTEYQLVAAARGLTIPAPDEIPSDLSPAPTINGSTSSTPKPVAIQHRPFAQTANSSSLPGPSIAHSGSGISAPSSFLRGRSKTLASLSQQDSPRDDAPPAEIHLPHEPQINGQPIEAYLYKDVLECPICFLYYPPYLNRTRCCDQPICSECFVQIKRPDPHPPEHLDPNSPVPEEIQRLEQEGQLVSEPACCPFCVQSEFGITYEPPPFRRGLAFANMPFSTHPQAYNATPMPHSNGTPLAPKRRRGQSVSALAPGVITTDRVRPDWATKLSDARAHAARRSAAATALHNAAYMMDGGQSRLGFGRRRRHFMVDPSGNGGEGRLVGSDGVPITNMDLLMAALGDPGSSAGRRGVTGSPAAMRFSSRGTRTDEIEELMMMEAIRQSLAAEEDRKKKEDKETAKKNKKEEKQKAKDQKAADKAAKKNGLSGLYHSSSNTSSVMSSPLSQSVPREPTDDGKGKGRAPTSTSVPSNAAMLGFNPLSEPTSTLNTETPEQSSSRRRGDSAGSSSGSSFAGSGSSSSLQEPQREMPTSGPFTSLAAMIDEDNEEDENNSKAVPDETAGEATPTQESHAPVIEGRYDNKGCDVSCNTVSNGQVTH